MAQSIQVYADFHAVQRHVIFYNPHRLSLGSCQRQETGVIHAQRTEARRKRRKLPAGPPKKVVENSVALCHRLACLTFPRPFEPRVTAVVAFYVVFHIYYHYRVPLLSFFSYFLFSTIPWLSSIFRRYLSLVVYSTAQHPPTNQPNNIRSNLANQPTARLWQNHPVYLRSQARQLPRKKSKPSYMNG